MSRANINDLLALLAAAREHSFTMAAPKRSVSPSALSHTVSGLEARLGLQLLNRITRGLAQRLRRQRPWASCARVVRNPHKGRDLPEAAQVVVGDVPQSDTLPAAVTGVDAIVFTLGSDGAGKVGAEHGSGRCLHHRQRLPDGRRCHRFLVVR